MIRIVLGLILASFITNSLAIVPFIDLLYKMRFVKPKEGTRDNKSKFDEMHDWKAGTPTGGGILIILLTIFLYVLITLIFPEELKTKSMYSFNDEVHILLLTFFSFGVLGLLDDWKKFFGRPVKGVEGQKFGVSARFKFALQWFLGLLIGVMLYLNLGINFVHLPFTTIVLPLGIFFIPFAAFIIVSMSNAYNITDGLDGLSTGLALIALTAFSVISFSSLDLSLSAFISLWLGSLVAYLYFNIYPARISLGDAGALSFGATLGVIGLLTGKIFAMVFICGIFIMEMLSSFIQMVSRKYFNKKVFPMAPVHLTFQLMGWHEAKIVQRAWVVGGILAIFGLWLALG